MVFGLDLVSSILLTASALALAYFFNGQLQRRLEKRTTSYHVKLEAFRAINQSAMGVIGALIGLRNLFGLLKENSLTDAEIIEIAWQLGLAREAERPLETAITDAMAADFKAASLEKEENERLEALRTWADATQFSLLVLYTRVLAFHIDALTLQAGQADLVSNHDDVESSLSRFQRMVLLYMEHTTDQAGRGSPSPEELDAEIATLNEEWQNLRLAMWVELDRTL